MKNYTIDNKGGTFDLAGYPVEHDSGYMVGLERIAVTNVGSLDYALSLALLAAEKYETAFVGTWIDGRGRIHVDISEHIDDYELAMKLAKDRNELAIWDCEALAEVAL